MTKTINQTDIDRLNSFLRGEMSAVETYTQALDKVDNPIAAAVLRENQASHAGRVEALRSEIRRLGGDPADSSGAWGAFAKAVAGGAKIFGESAAVAALEEGEDHGLKDYQSDIADCSPTTRNLVTSRLLVEQRRTHDALARIKKIVA